MSGTTHLSHFNKRRYIQHRRDGGTCFFRIYIRDSFSVYNCTMDQAALNTVQNTFGRVRQMISPQLNRITRVWSDCKQILWSTRWIVYITCLLSIVLLIFLILAWNKNFIVFLTGTLTVLTTYGALVASKQSCFSVFDNSIANALQEQAESAQAMSECARQATS